MATSRRRSSRTGPTFHDLVDGDLRRQEFRPVYLLVGKDSLRIERVVFHIRDKLLGPVGTDFNFHVRSGDQTSIEEVLAQAVSIPMLGREQVIWVREADQCLAERNAEEALQRYLAAPVPETRLILSAAKLDGRKKWVRQCREAGILFDFSPPQGAEVTAWVRKEAAKFGLALPEPLPEVLIDLVGEDLHALTAEISKLALVAEESDSELDQQKLEEVVMAQASAGPFQLVDNMLPGRVVPALKVWRNLAGWGQRADDLAPLVLWRIRKQALVANLRAEGFQGQELARLAGLPAWVCERLVQNTTQLGNEGVKHSLTAGHRCDAFLKRWAIRPDLVLERAIYDFCTPGTPLEQ